MNPGLVVKGQILILLWLAALLATPSRAEHNLPNEHETKAGFILNFAEFIEWPAGAFRDAGAPIVLGVVGEDPFGETLEKFAGKTVNGRPIEIRRFKGAREFRGEETPGRRQADLGAKRNRKIQELKACHILFVSSSEKSFLPLLLKPLKGASVLTIGDTAEFIRQGGVIRFVRVGSRVQFEVGLVASEQARLRISSKLLNLAHVVEAASRREKN